MNGTAIGFLLHPGDGRVIEPALDRLRRAGRSWWTIAARGGLDLSDRASQTGLLVTVGGDGTFLYGARIAAPLGMPVLGVNRGRLGFLTDVEVTDLPEALDAYLAGDHTTQARGLLSCQVFHRDRPPDGSLLALNDVVVKSRGVAVARLAVEADSELLGEFDADGVVVATATGSTAYALSAGGPPIDPRVRAVAVIPLAPHAVITRAVIVPDSVVLRVVVGRGRVLLAADGRGEEPLDEGDVVEIRAGPELRLVRLPTSPTFLRRLREKVRFGLPLKPADHPDDFDITQPEDNL